MNRHTLSMPGMSLPLTRRRVLGSGLALGALALGAGPVLAAAPSSASGRPQSGVPLFVDTVADLPSHDGSILESWYVNAAFESRGKILGFEWHQGISPMGSSTEFLLMNASDNVWRAYAKAEPASTEVGAATTELNVYSTIGGLTGNASQMRLKVASGNNAVDVILTPQGQTLYNGTTGLLHLLGSDSYEYAFTNMQGKGTVTIDGEEFPVDAGSVWFDRQWGKAGHADPAELARQAALINQAHWTWLGLTYGEGNRSAISFWDVMNPDSRQTFLTYLRDDGVQMNVDATVTYDGIWTSKQTSQRYPSSARIVAPTIELDITLEVLLDKPEFIYPAGQGHSGSQPLCHVTGHQSVTKIDKHVIYEMIGGVDV